MCDKTSYRITEAVKKRNDSAYGNGYYSILVLALKHICESFHQKVTSFDFPQ